MATPVPRYELELWVNGQLVADITKLAQNKRFTLRRNGSEELRFLMSLTAFEKYCAAQGVAPLSVLDGLITDIRVKRYGQYYFGVNVRPMQFNLNENDVNLEVIATGFLDLFMKRFITRSYPSSERTAIVRDALALTQSGDPSNDFGVLPGVQQYETDITDTERNYVDQNVRDLIVNMANLSDGKFDFRFNYDRSYEIFGQIGSDRPNNKFTYPYNIKGGTVARTPENIANYIIGLGSGFGEEALRTETADQVSRDKYKTQQAIISFNSVTEQQTLDENSYTYLQRLKDIFQLPSFKVSGKFADLSVLGVGDRVPVEVLGHTMLPLNKTYRIEQIDVSLDENDAEDITITVDDFGL